VSLDHAGTPCKSTVCSITYLGRIETEGYSKILNIVRVEHSWMNDCDALEEVRVLRGNGTDFASPAEAVQADAGISTLLQGLRHQFELGQTVLHVCAEIFKSM